MAIVSGMKPFNFQAIIEYQQKYLRMEDAPGHPETAICQCGTHWFYYDVNPFYVDTLDKKVIAKFIEVSYEPYYQKYGKEKNIWQHFV